MIGNIFSLILLVIMGFVGFTLFNSYRKQTTTGFQRWLDAARDSATLLWSKFVVIVACITGQLDTLADFAGVPEFKDVINNWVGNPKIISAVMLAIAFITIKARTRSGSNDPVK